MSVICWAPPTLCFPLHLKVDRRMTAPNKASDNVATTPGAPGLDLRLVWNVVQDRRGLVLLCGVLCFAVVMTYTLLSRMEFLVRGRLYLGELDEPSQYSGLSELTGSGGSDVFSEIEIMRSRSRVERAVLESGLNATLRPRGKDGVRLWRWLQSERDPALLDDDRKQLRVARAALPDRASQTATFSVELTDADSFIVRDQDQKQILQGSLGETIESEHLTLALVPGEASMPRAGDVYILSVLPTEKTVDAILRKLDITVPKSPVAATPVKVLALELTSPQPFQASAFLNALMQTHLAERQTWKTEDAEAAEGVIVQQLAGMQSSLDHSEQELARYKSDNPVVAQQTQPQVIVSQLAAYEQQRTAARLQVTTLESMLKNLERPDANIEAYLLGETPDNVLLQLGNALTVSRQQLVELRSRASDTMTEVKQAKAKVDEQLSMIRNYVTGRLARARAQVQQLEAVIAQHNAELSAVPTAELALAQIGRRSDVYSRVYSYLLESQQRTAIAKATKRSKNRILDLPTVPAREVAPNLWLRMLSLPLGICLAALLVVVRALSSGRLRTEAEVRAALRSTTVFANVPRIPRKLLSKRSVPVYDLAALPFEGLGLAEAFRTLRANLYYNLSGPLGKVILITSPSPGDGKTTSALCLAGALAADQKRVLLVDADLRKPSHFQLLGHEPGQSFSKLDDGTVGVSFTPHRIYLSHGVVHAVDPGFGVAAETLSSEAFVRFLERVRLEYDFVLLDAPSYPATADPLVLASQADFALTVIRLGNTARADAEAHIYGVLSRVRGHALVVNDSHAVSAEGYPRPARATRLQPHQTVQLLPTTKALTRDSSN
jgi:tyrosine-protein kinase Etk/Wzc